MSRWVLPFVFPLNSGISKAIPGDPLDFGEDFGKRRVCGPENTALRSNTPSNSTFKGLNSVVGVHFGTSGPCASRVDFCGVSRSDVFGRLSPHWNVIHWLAHLRQATPSEGASFPKRAYRWLSLLGSPWWPPVWHSVSSRHTPFSGKTSWY